MNKRLFRTQFNQMENIEKQVLMESLAARYDMTFLGLHTFDRWGQSCTTGIFEKDGRKFVFVPGDTVTLGWEQFAVASLTTVQIILCPSFSVRLTGNSTSSPSGRVIVT